MICHCDYCHYTFDSLICCSMDAVPERCPDCGKAEVGSHAAAVRKATPEEVAEYRRIRAEIAKERAEIAE